MNDYYCARVIDKNCQALAEQTSCLFHPLHTWLLNELKQKPSDVTGEILYRHSMKPFVRYQGKVS